MNTLLMKCFLWRLSEAINEIHSSTHPLFPKPIAGNLTHERIQIKYSLTLFELRAWNSNESLVTQIYEHDTTSATIAGLIWLRSLVKQYDKIDNVFGIVFCATQKSTQTFSIIGEIGMGTPNLTGKLSQLRSSYSLKEDWWKAVFGLENIKRISTAISESKCSPL